MHTGHSNRSKRKHVVGFCLPPHGTHGYASTLPPSICLGSACRLMAPMAPQAFALSDRKRSSVGQNFGRRS